MIRQAKTKTFNGNLDIRGRGNRTELVRTVFPFVDGRFGSGSKVNWEYDLTSQLTFERYFLANSTEFLTQEFLNDDAGNRETHNVNYFDQSRSVAGTYNAANELTGLEISSPSTSPTNVTFEHNKRGGRTKMTTNAGGSDSVVVNYGYNEDNSMTQYGVVAPGRQLNVAFAYSGGLRVEKQVTGFITTGGQQQVYNAHKKYLLDGVDVLLELQVIASTEYVTVLNIPGVLSATLIEGGASVVRYQLHDAQGNVVGLVDTDQEVGPVYLQDSWGIPLVDSDCQTVSLASSPIQVESVPNPYRWGGEHGYYWDEDVGLYLLGLRWYESFTGRFLTTDPIGFGGGDPNLFRPMGNNPVNEIDPEGLYKRNPRRLFASRLPSNTETERLALEEPHEVILDLLGKVWNLPNTLLAAGLGLIGWVVSGGRGQIRFGNNAIEFTENPIPVLLGAEAMAPGNVILYSPGADPNDEKFYYVYVLQKLSRHEVRHTYQGQFFGPFFLPLFWLAQLHAWATGSLNIFEADAVEHGRVENNKENWRNRKRLFGR